MPSHVKNWLSESGSLTQRIKQTFSGVFSVQPQQQGSSTAFITDAERLGIAQQEEAFVREVILMVSGRAMVFARTTVKASSLKTLEKLTKLGDKPLGEVIFSYPSLKRPQLHVASVHVSQLSKNMAEALGTTDFLWARRNTYEIEGQQFLVSEFFLPAMFEV
jgi:chorismate--pyruvate lyase